MAGNAADAAIATALTQITTALGTNISFAGIVEVLYYDAKTHRTYSLNAGWNAWSDEKDRAAIPLSPTLSGLPGLQNAQAAGSVAAGRRTLVPGFMAGMEAPASEVRQAQVCGSVRSGDLLRGKWSDNLARAGRLFFCVPALPGRKPGWPPIHAAIGSRSAALGGCLCPERSCGHAARRSQGRCAGDVFRPLGAKLRCCSLRGRRQSVSWGHEAGTGCSGRNLRAAHSRVMKSAFHHRGWAGRFSNPSHSSRTLDLPAGRRIRETRTRCSVFPEFSHGL